MFGVKNQQSYDETMCPYCDENFVKIVGHKHYSSTNYTAPWSGRGSLFVLAWECESGHKWYQCFGFHKGNTIEFFHPLDPESNEGTEQNWSFSEWLKG